MSSSLANPKNASAIPKALTNLISLISLSPRTNAATNWEKGSDGYWYYKLPVNVGKETEELIESCSLKDGITAPDGYYLSVEIVASSIQSTPPRVVTEQWDSGVSGVNGSTLIIK